MSRREAHERSADPVTIVPECFLLTGPYILVPWGQWSDMSTRYQGAMFAVGSVIPHRRLLNKVTNIVKPNENVS